MDQQPENYIPPTYDNEFAFESDHDIDCHCEECDPWINDDLIYEFNKESAA